MGKELSRNYYRAWAWLRGPVQQHGKGKERCSIGTYQTELKLGRMGKVDGMEAGMALAVPHGQEKEKGNRTGKKKLLRSSHLDDHR